MRVDLKFNSASYSEKQRFFLECWYNMVHQYSVDSYRLKTMNPVNSARELYSVWSMSHASKEDKFLVFKEAVEVISASKDVFDAQELRLLHHLKSFSSKIKKDNVEFDNSSLVVPIASSLYKQLEGNFITQCQEYLTKTLVENGDEPTEEGELQSMKSLISNFLSALLDRGSSIESLFNFYKGILAKDQGAPDYPFEKRLGLLFRILNSDIQEFKVAFALYGINSSTERVFPDQIGDISFPDNIGELIKSQKVQNKQFTTIHPSKKFAVISIKESDARHAGTLAYERIYKTLDLLRFEFSSEPIRVSEEFICLNEDRSYNGRVFGIPKVVPNPVDITSIERNLAELLQQVETLVLSYPHE